MSRSVLVLSSLALLAACAALVSFTAPSAAASSSRPRTEVLLEVDADGEVTAGSREELMEAVRDGAALRVGWSLEMKLPGEDEPRLLEHWADAGFVTLWQGEVFAQLHDIRVQGPMIDRAALVLQPEPHGWTAIVGSTGEFRQVFGEEVSTMNAPTRWAVTR